MGRRVSEVTGESNLRAGSCSLNFLATLRVATAAMSRSVFAGLFQAILGQSPLSYLTA